MDIYLLEAVLNGVLLGGVLALLALGLNLIFGVVDVVWIAYAELVMCGMYAIYWLDAFFGWWDPNRPSPFDGEKGTWVPCEGGRWYPFDDPSTFGPAHTQVHCFGK